MVSSYYADKGKQKSRNCQAFRDFYKYNMVSRLFDHDLLSISNVESLGGLIHTLALEIIIDVR